MEIRNRMPKVIGIDLYIKHEKGMIFGFQISTNIQADSIINKILFLVIVLLSLELSAQIPHEHPEHPKGNSAAMYQALPFYNEACELYANGLIERAKISLHNAINISFELTEAQLFLAEIFYDQGKIDSAFLYYNSGIDFNIEQKPHYYFKLFQTGLLLGQYGRVKHAIGHFVKLYGQLGSEKTYEEGYSFKREDLEYYQACIAMIYDYTSWRQIAKFQTAFPNESRFVNEVEGKDILLLKDGANIKKTRKCKSKFTTIKGIPHKAIDLFISKDGKIAIYSLKKDSIICLFVKKRNGKKFGEPILLSESINRSDWQGSPFLTSDKKHLYFSSIFNGNKDLFVAKIDMESLNIEYVKPLNRINTLNDEQSLSIDEENKTIYFVSNGRVGFGGFDIFYCNHFEIVDGIIFPFDPQNIGGTFNSNHNEVSLYRKNQRYIMSREVEGVIRTEGYTPIKKDDFVYELAPKIFPENEE